MKISFYAIVKSGQLVWENPGQLASYLLSLEGRGVAVSIGRRFKGRSIQQNKYLWSCVYPAIADWVGEENIEDIHETMKSMFLVDRTKKIPVVRSTTRLTTVEMNEYIERIAVFAAKNGVIIPEAI